MACRKGWLSTENLVWPTRGLSPRRALDRNAGYTELPEGRGGRTLGPGSCALRGAGSQVVLDAGCSGPLMAPGSALSHRRDRVVAAELAGYRGLQPSSNQAQCACCFLSFSFCGMRIPAAQETLQSTPSLTALESADGKMAAAPGGWGGRTARPRCCPRFCSLLSGEAGHPLAPSPQPRVGRVRLRQGGKAHYGCSSRGKLRGRFPKASLSYWVPDILGGRDSPSSVLTPLQSGKPQQVTVTLVEHSSFPGAGSLAPHLISTSSPYPKLSNSRGRQTTDICLFCPMKLRIPFCFCDSGSQLG